MQKKDEILSFHKKQKIISILSYVLFANQYVPANFSL